MFFDAKYTVPVLHFLAFCATKEAFIISEETIASSCLWGSLKLGKKKRPPGEGG